MRIADAEHLAIHSARGALFENLVISEQLKQRFNQGLASNLYFWRNNTGEEVDLVLDGLSKWKKYAGDAALPAQFVYGGDENMQRHNVAVQSWRYIR